MYEDFGKSSKAKVLTKLSKWEKNNNSVYIGVSISKKVIDGKEVTTLKVDRSGPCDINSKQPLPQEFTDVKAFESYLEKVVEGIKGQL